MAEGYDTLESKVNRALASFNIFGGWGSNWSVMKGGHVLVRLGTNPDQGTTKVLVWDMPNHTSETLLHPTDGNLIDTVSGSDAADVGHIFDIEGGYFNASGDLVRLTQRVTTNGRNKVTLSVPLARVGEVREVDIAPLLGDIYVYQDTPVTNGVPDDLDKVSNFVSLAEGVTQSQKCATFTARDEILILMGGLFAVNKKQEAYAEFFIQHKDISSDTWRKALGEFTLNTRGTATLSLDTPVPTIIPPNQDVRTMCEASASSTQTSATLMGFFAKQTG